MPLIAAMLGLMAISGHSLTYGVSVLLLPCLVVASHTRKETFVNMAAYFSAAASILPQALIDFDGGNSESMAVLTFVGVVGLMAGLWALSWVESFRLRVRNTMLMSLILAIPPLGVIGVMNPISGLGALVPGTGLLGITLFLTGAYLISSGRGTAAGLVFTGLLLLSLGSPQSAEKPLWKGVGTAYSLAPQNTPYASYVRLLSELPGHRHEEHLAFSESFLSGVEPAHVAEILAHKTEAESAIFGFQPSKGANGLLYVGRGGETKVYLQRQPIPLTMWNPLADNHYAANWSSSPVISVQGRVIAPLICYESLLVWPIVASVASGANTIVTISNVKWDSSKKIARLLISVNRNWAQLFDIPLTIAING